MEIVVNILIPMFLIMLTGFLCIHFKILPQETPHFLISFIFNVAAPALIFIGMATAPLSQIFHWDFIFATIIAIAICFFPWIFFIKKCYPQKSTGFAALIAYSVSLGNSAFIGLPILVLVAGSKGMILAVVSSVIVVSVFMPSVIYFMNKSINKNTEKVKYGVLKDVLKIFKNPIVLSGFLGILYSAANLPMPAVAKSYFTTLGSALAPVALFAVGAGIMWANIKDYWKILSVMSFFKMIICPAIAYLVAVLLHLNNLETFALVLIAAVPSPKTAYILAEEYNFEPELMAGHIALTTVIGVVTIFGLILFASSVDPTLFKALPG